MSSEQRPLSSAPAELVRPGAQTAQCIVYGTGRRPRCNQPMQRLLQQLLAPFSNRRKRALQRRFFDRLQRLALATQGAGLPLHSRFCLRVHETLVQFHVECRPKKDKHHDIGSRCLITALQVMPSPTIERHAEARPKGPSEGATGNLVCTPAKVPPHLAEDFAAINKHPWPMFIVSTMGDLVLRNRTAELMLSADLCQMTSAIEALVHPDEALMVKGLWHEALACGRPLQLFARLKRSSGGFATSLLRADPQTDPTGRVTHFTCAVLETHTTQWLGMVASPTESDGVSNSFLTVASHELRTPLTSLQLTLQLALQRLQRQHGAVPPGVAIEHMVSRSLKQTHRLIEVVSDILDASRIHLDKLQLRHSRVDLRQTLLDTLAIFDRPFSEAGCRATIALEEDIYGFWDRGRVEQVFFDLLANVLKHAPNSHVVVSARVEQETAVITVQDDGPGIPASQHGQIFGRFGRAAQCRGISGLGLGLYLCRRIVEDHGGSLLVHSNLGEGATFTVKLPLCGMQRAEVGEIGQNRAAAHP